MGLYVTGRFLPHETTTEQWAKVYSEVLQLVNAYDFLDIIFDKERFAKFGLMWQYCVKTKERQIRDELGILIYGALHGCVTCEDQALYKNLFYYLKKNSYSDELTEKPEGDICSDALVAVLKNRYNFDELNEYQDFTRTIFGNKTQGYAHHNYLLAICLLLEDRLGKAFVTCGNITRGQINFAINWANKHLEHPISPPARMNNEKLLTRLKTFVPQNKILRAFLDLTFNPQDEEMGAFIKANFTDEEIFSYWQNEAEETIPGTFGASDFFQDYFAMSDDLSLLTQVCLKKYTPEDYVKQLANSRIFEESKETSDPARLTKAGSDRETPETIQTVMGKFFGMGLRNSAVTRHIPLSKGIEAIRPFIPNAEELLNATMEERAPKHKDFEETLETFDEHQNKLVEKIETVDIYDSGDLVFYERGDTMSENIKSNLKQIREFVDGHKTQMKEDFLKLYSEDESRNKINTRMAVLVNLGKQLLPKTAWDYFESRITDDEFFDTILALHGLKSDTIPICYYIKGLLCSSELFEDVLMGDGLS